MFNRITVIGVGSLGGFVADAISSLASVKELEIIDFDKVEPKNLINSIYTRDCVNKLKVDALRDIIKDKNPRVKVIKRNEKFIEGSSKISRKSFVIDCRDYNHDRSGAIDVRLFISSRYLIVDCRTRVSYGDDEREGKYLTQLTRTDLKNAAVIISMLIYNGTIETLTYNNSINKYDLDYLTKISYLPEPEDIVFDSGKNDVTSLVNVEQSIKPMIDMNKLSDINVYVGGKDLPIVSNVIPQLTLNSGMDVISNLLSSIQTPLKFDKFIVYISQDQTECYVELLPECGAA